MRTLDSVTLNWCNKHQNWWVTNCPDCMIDSNEDDIRKAGIKEVVEYVEEHRNSLSLNNITFRIPVRDWQAKLKEWGIE